MYAADAGADVILMSFSNPGFSPALQAAIDYAWESGAVLVAATGNDASSSVTYPAGDRGVVGVASTDASDTLAASSNYGAAAFMAAPGVSITTTAAGSGVASISGTSAAAASVAGAAALLSANEPLLTNGVIVGRLARTADPAGDPTQTGNGRLNLARAMADASTDSVQPAGAAPLGSGGPLVGPYTAAVPAPSVAITFPVPANSYNNTSWTNGGCTAGTGRICGTAAVGGGGVTLTSVEWSLQQVSTTKWWNGTTFSATTENLITAIGTTSWSAVFAATNFLVDGSYSLHARANQSDGKPGDQTITFAIDRTAPTVTNVTSSIADGTYGIGSVIPVRVTFSENVTVTGTPQLTLATGGAGTPVNYSSGSGTNTLTFTYTVAAGDSSSDLDYRNTSSLALNGGTIKDAATNNATLTLASPGSAGSLGANKVIVIETVQPTVTNVTSSKADGSYNAGVLIPIQVTFSENVTVTGTPQLTLETGATDAVVNYTSGSGTTTLTFNYTVAAGHTSTDLDYTSTTALALNSGTIKDAAGNNAVLTLAAPGAAGSLGANKALVIDTTAPDTTIDSGPSGSVSSTGASFTFSSSEAGSTFACSLHGAAFTTCSSPKSYTGLSEAGHTFAVRATDAAGNTDATPASRSWTLDTTAPSVSTPDLDAASDSGSSDSDNLTNTNSGLIFNGTAEADATVELFRDGSSLGTTSASGGAWTFTDSDTLAEGTYAYTATATAAGNTSAASAALSVTVDTTDPAIDLVLWTDPIFSGNVMAVTASGTAEPNAAVHVTLSDGSTTLAQDTTADGSGSWSVTFDASTLADGGVTYTATATDAAGNSASDTQETALKDTVAPSVSAPDLDAASDSGSSDSDDLTNIDSGLIFNGTAEADATVELFRDGVSLGTTSADGAGAWSITDGDTLLDGTHAYTATATDAAGNTSAASAALSVTVDTAAPDTTITAGPSGSVSSTSASFSFTSSEASSTFECKLDAGSFVTCTSPKLYTGLSDASHTFEVRATDAAGNTDATPASRTWTVDTAAPTSSVTFPVTSGVYSESSWDVGCATPSGDFCGSSADGLGSGIQSVQFTMQQASTGKYWNGASFSSTTPYWFAPTSLTLTGNSASWSKAFPYTNFPATGSYQLRASAMDHAGNQENPGTSVTFQLNRYTIDFLTPIDDSTPTMIVTNVGKNGRVIPVKVAVFLEGYAQTDTQIAAGTLTIGVAHMTSCSSNLTDSIEVYADAGMSNAGTNQFRWASDSPGLWIYNLDTKALGMQTNQCYRIDVFLNGVKLSTQDFAVFRPTK